MEWKPIESAPRDDYEDVLLWSDGAALIGYWDGYAWCSFDTSVANAYGDLQRKPTHWMPLPEPPE